MKLGDGVEANGQRQSVLVCDSDLQSLRAFRAVLRGSGLVVWPTQSAEEALIRAALRAPAAAIVEMDLADSSETEMCQLLRPWSCMPLIIVSHVSGEDRMVEAFRAGVDDYLTKPFSPRELVVRLEAHLRRETVARDEPVEAVASASLSAPASDAVCAAGRARCARLEGAGVSAAAGYGAYLPSAERLLPLRPSWPSGPSLSRKTIWPRWSPRR